MFPGVYTGEMEMAGRDFSYKESSFYRKLYPSFLFLCSAFAGTGILFVSPLLSLALLSAGPAVEDYRTGYVDDRWSILILLTGAVYRGIHHSFYEGFLSFLLAALVYGAVFFVVPEGIGTGDIFLSAAIAFWLEPAGVFFFIWSSCLIGAAAAAVLLIFYHVPKTYPFRFCPCIALGGVGTFVCQEMYPAVFTARFFTF